MPASEVLHSDAIAGAIRDLADAVVREHPAGQPLNVVGIRTRGETLAARLRTLLAEAEIEVRTGTVDITLYRDDLSEIGPVPLVRPSDLDIEVDGIPMLLVDDVIYTGRSIRAALEAITHFGRPAYIRLAVLIDRGGRELPIHPDYIGRILDVPRGARVNVRLREDDGRDAVEVAGTEGGS